MGQRTAHIRDHDTTPHRPPPPAARPYLSLPLYNTATSRWPQDDLKVISKRPQADLNVISWSSLTAISHLLQKAISRRHHGHLTAKSRRPQGDLNVISRSSHGCFKNATSTRTQRDLKTTLGGAVSRATSLSSHVTPMPIPQTDEAVY